MTIDLGKLQAALRDAARQAFTELRAAHPNEAFYAYALYTDDDFSTVSPSANSEEKLAARLKKDKAKPGSPEAAAARWGTAEWAYEAHGDEHFDDAYKLLGTAYNKHADDRFTAYKNAAAHAMVGALRELDADGFFGKGAARAKVTLFISVSDSDDAERVEDKSAKMLNPPAVAAAFKKRHG